MAASKKPTGAYTKDSKKKVAQATFKANVKSGKAKPVEAGMTGAMVAKVAGKVASKVLPKAAKALKPEEKYAVKFVKDIAKKGKTGDVQKTLDAMPSATKRQFSNALQKASGDRSAVYKSTKQAEPLYQKMQIRSNTPLDKKIIKMTNTSSKKK